MTDEQLQAPYQEERLDYDNTDIENFLMSEYQEFQEYLYDENSRLEEILKYEGVKAVVKHYSSNVATQRDKDEIEKFMDMYSFEEYLLIN